MQTFEALMFTFSLIIRAALRTRVNISAIGSLKLIFLLLILPPAQPALLPARLFHSGYLAFVSKLPKANPAKLKLLINSSGPAANLTTSVLPYFELLFRSCLVNKGLR
jgi:hypothetical protein